MKCYNSETGGFSGNIGHDTHLLYTLSAIQILAITDELHLLNQIDHDTTYKHKIIQYISSLQQSDGSFAGDTSKLTEIDTRFSYCAISALSILHSLTSINTDTAAEYILSCQNDVDGGFGVIPGGESHAGQIFCCIGALAILGRLHHPDKLTLFSQKKLDLLCWWISERQCDSGGLNGRPEKQADVCYSWWILSTLSILGRMNWISQGKLINFILKCQDDEDGGVADRPQNMSDVFHTFFGISGLSLMGYLKTLTNPSNNTNGIYRTIDPLYALPDDVVKRLKLQGQVIIHNKNVNDDDAEDDDGVNENIFGCDTYDIVYL